MPQIEKDRQVRAVSRTPSATDAYLITEAAGMARASQRATPRTGAVGKTRKSMFALFDDKEEAVLRRIEALARVRETSPDISCLPCKLRVSAQKAISRGRKLRERDRRETEIFSKWLKVGIPWLKRAV